MAHRNFIFAGCVYFVCYRVYTASVFNILSDWTDEQEKQMTSEELEEDLLEPILIPLPFTTRIVPSPPYKSTDPEWQAFVKLSKNKQLVRRVQGKS